MSQCGFGLHIKTRCLAGVTRMTPTTLAMFSLMVLENFQVAATYLQFKLMF